MENMGLDDKQYYGTRWRGGRVIAFILGSKGDRLNVSAGADVDVQEPEAHMLENRKRAGGFWLRRGVWVTLTLLVIYYIMTLIL